MAAATAAAAAAAAGEGMEPRALQYEQTLVSETQGLRYAPTAAGCPGKCEDRRPTLTGLSLPQLWKLRFGIRQAVGSECWKAACWFLAETGGLQRTVTPGTWPRCPSAYPLLHTRFGFSSSLSTRTQVTALPCSL